MGQSTSQSANTVTYTIIMGMFSGRRNYNPQSKNQIVALANNLVTVVA